MPCSPRLGCTTSPGVRSCSRVSNLLSHCFYQGPPFSADNVDLGTACGKLHRVSVLVITDPGKIFARAARSEMSPSSNESGS